MVILLKSGYFRPSFKSVIFNFIFNPEQAKIKICFITYSFRGRRINNILELKKQDLCVVQFIYILADILARHSDSPFQLYV